jgi:hypothetical protein
MEVEPQASPQDQWKVEKGGPLATHLDVADPSKSSAIFATGYVINGT